MTATNNNSSHSIKFSYKFLIVLFALLLVGCGERRSGPGYSMILPEATITPAPVQAIASFREESLETIEKAQDDEIIAAVTSEGQPVFVAMAQSGLWMGVADANGSYAWSRPPALPDLLTTSEISALSISENEDWNQLWVGTHNNGLFRLALNGDSGNNLAGEWVNHTVENSEMPSNRVNRIKEWLVLTAKGAVGPQPEGEKWTFWNAEDGLLDDNTRDYGWWSTYAGGGIVIATTLGVERLKGGDEKFERVSGGSYCRFEHASRIYSAFGNVWVFIDQKDERAPGGWRVVGVCEGSQFLGFQWNPIFLDGASYPNPRIATHYQDAGGRVWIALSPNAEHPQGALASYHDWHGKWTQHQLPAEFPAIADDATLLRVGNDLWVENSEGTAFTVLENVLAEE